MTIHPAAGPDASPLGVSVVVEADEVTDGEESFQADSEDGEISLLARPLCRYCAEITIEISNSDSSSSDGVPIGMLLSLMNGYNFLR